MSEKSVKFYNFLNKHKWIYLSIGIIMFGGGAFVLATKKESFLAEAAGHFQLILGEALIVFFIINVVLEQEAREALVSQISNVVRAQEDRLVKSVTATTEEVSKQEQILTRTISDASNAIVTQQTELKEAFAKTAETLKSQADNLQERLNNDVFKIILSERTCHEIATEMNNIGYFKPDFLFYNYKLTLEFSYDEPNNAVILVQHDEFFVKNFAKEAKDYKLRFSTFATDTRKYEYIQSGAAKDEKSRVKNFVIKNFEEEPIKELKEGFQYELKPEFRPSVKPSESTKAFLKLKTTFYNFTGTITDYSFTNLYMMPSTIEVTVPNDFEFSLYPTFPAKIESETDVNGTLIYKLPFITPGQGYNFSLVKQKLLGIV